MNGEAEKHKLKTNASSFLTKEDGAGYLFAVKPRNESFESHRKEERECRVRICSSHLSSRGIASAMKGPSPSPLVSLDLGHGHFWYNGVWVVWASGPGGGPLSLHDDITVISTKHAERDEKRGKRDVTSTFAATTLARASLPPCPFSGTAVAKIILALDVA